MPSPACSEQVKTPPRQARHANVLFPSVQPDLQPEPTEAHPSTCLPPSAYRTSNFSPSVHCSGPQSYVTCTPLLHGGASGSVSWQHAHLLPYLGPLTPSSASSSKWWSEQQIVTHTELALSCFCLQHLPSLPRATYPRTSSASARSPARRRGSGSCPPRSRLAGTSRRTARTCAFRRMRARRALRRGCVAVRRREHGVLNGRRDAVGETPDIQFGAPDSRHGAQNLPGKGTLEKTSTMRRMGRAAMNSAWSRAEDDLPHLAASCSFV